MIRPFAHPLLACLLVAGALSPAQAKPQQEMPEAEAQMKELYKKMAAILCGGAADKQSMLILANPGLPLTQKFDASDPNDQAILDQLADQIPRPAPLFSPNGGRVSDIYTQILQNKQLAKVDPITNDEERRLKAALELTNPDGPTMKKYVELRDKYTDAQSRQSSAEMEETLAKMDYEAVKNGSDAKAKAAGLRTYLEAQRKAREAGKATVEALQSWENAGFKGQVKAATDTITSLAAKTGEAWWTSLKEKATAAGMGTEGGLHATFFPEPRTWHDNGNDWTYVHFKAGEKVDENKLKAESWYATANGSSGWFSLDASARSMDMTYASLFENKDLAISFEVKRVSVLRKWLDMGVFSNTNWTFPVGGTAVSYGDLAKNKDKKCSLPLLVTTFYIIRNLRISTKIDQSTLGMFEKSISAHARVGLGPFTLSGGYDKRDQGKEEKTSFSQTGIACEGIQILGFLATVPPKSPAASLK